MAELTLRDRLQPSLFDRLIDEERVLTVFELSMENETLDLWKLTPPDIEAAIAAQCALAEGVADFVVATVGASATQLRFSAPNGRVSLSALKAVRLKSAARSEELLLAEICTISTRSTLNSTPESADKRYATARRLRSYVCRDVARLLNSTSIDSTVDLETAPHVRQSVLNYGMPSLSGKNVSSIDRVAMARRLEQVVRIYEPRLRKVRVSPDHGAPRSDPHEMAFRIDCELWNQPEPNQLVLRTRISMESGRARVEIPGGTWIQD